MPLIIAVLRQASRTGRGKTGMYQRFPATKTGRPESQWIYRMYPIQRGDPLTQRLKIHILILTNLVRRCLSTAARIFSVPTSAFGLQISPVRCLYSERPAVRRTR